MEKTKVCTKCGEEKETSKNYFYAQRGCKDGLRPMCKECENKLKKIYRNNNIEKISKRQHICYMKHRDNRIEKQREYQKNNLDERLKYGEKYREINRQKLNDAAKLYYYNNHDERLRYNNEYSRKNREEKLKYNKEYYRNNREKLIENVKKYGKNYYRTEHFKILARKKRQRRRSNEHRLEANLTIEQWEKCKEYFNDNCCYCGNGIKLSQDHFIPLTNGGEYTLNNIVPCCQKCNSSKGTKKFFEWYPEQIFYNKKREQKILKYLNYDDKIKNQQLALSL